MLNMWYGLNQRYGAASSGSIKDVCSAPARVLAYNQHGMEKLCKLVLFLNTILSRISVIERAVEDGAGATLSYGSSSTKMRLRAVQAKYRYPKSNGTVKLSKKGMIAPLCYRNAWGNKWGKAGGCFRIFEIK
jgi:hypothetical protein